MRKIKRKFATKRKHHGFSLIEVAIAIVVISLITSFVLKGRELIHNAKLRTIIEQVDIIRVATQTFIDKYGSLPGTLDNAQEIFGAGIASGNGQSILQTSEDSRKFWSHLQAANLINFELINGYPTSKLGGKYTVSTNIQNHAGTWIILSGFNDNGEDLQGILTPEEAYYIDKNADNGNPLTGDINTIAGTNAQGECFIANKYNFKNKNKDCVIMFRIL